MNTERAWKDKATNLHSKITDLEQLLSRYELDTSVESTSANEFKIDYKFRRNKSRTQKSSLNSEGFSLYKDPGANLVRTARPIQKMTRIQDPESPQIKNEETVKGAIIKSNPETQNYKLNLDDIEEHQRNKAQMIIKDQQILLLQKENEIKGNENLQLKLKIKDLYKDIDTNQTQLKELENKLKGKDQEIFQFKNSDEIIKDFYYENIELEILKQKYSKLLLSSNENELKLSQEIQRMKTKNKNLIRDTAKLQENIEMLHQNQHIARRYNSASYLNNRLNQKKMKQNFGDLSKKQIIDLFMILEEKYFEKEQEILHLKTGTK